ncbi:MAG: hypothetical protein ACP5U2_07475, partial [Bryobacteraceae bacterium]
MLRLTSGLLFVAMASAQEFFDLAPFARPCCAEERHALQTTFDYAPPAGLVPRTGGGWVYGLQWAEERDVARIRLRFRQDARPVAPGVQYWFRNWPLPKPDGHTIEDRVDDPWQGRWLAAHTAWRCQGSACEISFSPLEAAENSNARHLPGVRYRRTLKIRLLFDGAERPALESVQVFSESLVKRVEFRLRMPGAQPHLEAY